MSTALQWLLREHGQRDSDLRFRERVFIGAGSNLGDRKSLIGEAIKALDENPDIEVVAESGLYETEPVGLVDQRDFLNAVIEIRTSLDPKRLLICLKQVERDLGRQPRRDWGPREIDLDILLMGDRVIESPELVIPHSEMRNRRFVLKPLAELASDLTHPVLGRKICDLLDGLEDERGVKPFPRNQAQENRAQNEPRQSDRVQRKSSSNNLSSV